MSDEPRIQFNNQIMDQPQNPPTQPFNNGESAQHHYADPHKELMQILKDANLPELQRFLKTQSNTAELINRREPIFQQTAMYLAVQVKDPHLAVEVTRTLVEAGGKVTVKDIHGQSPLFYVCRDGNIGLLHIFIANGCDINEADNFKQSPLFYASRDGRADCVLEMLRNGVNPEHRDKVNETALFYAAREGHTKICEILIDYGADVNTVDDKKQTALFFARKAGHKSTEDLLIAKGAINTKDGRVTKADLNRVVKQKIVTPTPSESKAQSLKNSSKLIQKRKKQPSATEEPRVSYKLIFTDNNLNTTDVSESDFLKFRQQYPQVAELILNPGRLDTNREISDKLQRENWQTVANQLLNTLWKAKGANIFHLPVDHVKLNIPDYPSIVTHPMDFGTIKKKLALNVYSELQDFLNDMGQVFYNCRLYNGTESFVGKIGVDVNREYDNLLQAYGLKERFDNKMDTNALIAEILGSKGYTEEPQRIPQQDTYQSQKQDQVSSDNNRPVEQENSPSITNNGPEQNPSTQQNDEQSTQVNNGEVKHPINVEEQLKEE